MLDVDGDGVFELGSFAEMSGAASVRGRKAPLDPVVLSGVFRSVARDGAVTRSGYRFRMFLRDADGTWTCADPPPEGLVAEGGLLVYAWPCTQGVSGGRTFVIDGTGPVAYTRCARYSGPSGPAAGAAPLVGDALVGGTGADGNVWTLAP